MRDAPDHKSTATEMKFREERAPSALPVPEQAALSASEGAARQSAGRWSRLAGVAAFVRAVFVPGKDEQKPDAALPELARGLLAGRFGRGGQNVGLFAAMDAPLHGLTADDLRYAGEVDAALARRPRFGARTLSVTVAVMLFFLLIWAAVADIDEVTHAEGQVVGSQRTQTIQNLEGGILR